MAAERTPGCVVCKEDGFYSSKDELDSERRSLEVEAEYVGDWDG